MPSDQRPAARDDLVAGRMSRQKRRDTAPEMAVRRELHRRGFRYRVNAPLPGMPRRRADLLFTRVHVVVFIDGCFWHACPEHATSPANNAEWWSAKLAANIARDRDTDAGLTAAGWTAIRFWEHEAVTAVVEAIAHHIGETITERNRLTPMGWTRTSGAGRQSG